MRRSVIALAAALAIALAACDLEPSAQQSEASARQTSYETLTANQPANPMTYSPTRESVNRWAEVWSEPGKLSFVYLRNMLGEVTGYYVFEGLPVSYCAMLTPNYEIVGRESRVVVPAPGIDGAYYGDGPCNQYYGWDATTGAYMEFSIGGGQDYLLYDQPLPADFNVQPLGQTTIEDVEEMFDADEPDVEIDSDDGNADG